MAPGATAYWAAVKESKLSYCNMGIRLNYQNMGM